MFRVGWRKSLKGSATPASVCIFVTKTYEKMSTTTTKICSHYRLLLCSSGKWCHVHCSDKFKLFVNGIFTECFHFLYYITFICVWRMRSSRFTHWLWQCQSCVYNLEVPYLWICFTFVPNFSVCVCVCVCECMHAYVDRVTLHPEASCSVDIILVILMSP